MISPFERHLREAIELNRERAPLYAALSGGASRPISIMLITAESLLILAARWFDRAAAPYHRAGVPLLETLFEPMSAAPPFVAHRPWVSAACAREVVNARAIRRRVEGALRERGFEGAADVLAAELRALSAEPQANCLVRHLLESAHRLTVLAPDHIALAGERGLATPAPLLACLCSLHLRGLGPAARLDRRARPLQMRGVAILAQDVPPIPLMSSSVSATLFARQS